MLKVTFHSRVGNKEFTNVESHKSLMDAKLRASALGWTITDIQPEPHPVYEPVVFHTITSGSLS